MMRQSRYWLPNAQHSLEVLWAVFESAAWALLSSTQRLQVMVGHSPSCGELAVQQRQGGARQG
jgi:hypothetical protein